MRTFPLYNGPVASEVELMTDINTAHWGFWLVPLGVAICFGPALLVWLWAEIKAGREKKK
jgi:hypothetical protein